MAVAIVGWHAPLFLISSYGLQPYEAVTTVAVTFWYGWLFNHAAGSVLIALIAHATEGSINTSDLWQAGPDLTRETWLYVVVWSELPSPCHRQPPLLEPSRPSHRHLPRHHTGACLHDHHTTRPRITGTSLMERLAHPAGRRGCLVRNDHVALFAIGGAGLWAQQQRDGAGYFTAGPERVTTSTYALSSPSLDVGGAWPDAFYTNDLLGDVRIDFESKTAGAEVFVGVGQAADVAAYLNGVGHDEVSDFDVDPFKLSTTARAGDEPSTAPAAQSFWVASATGAGPST